MLGGPLSVLALLVCSALPSAAQDLATAVATAAHAACRVANDSVVAMYPGLQQTWNDNNAAQGLLAQAQERLHLAALPLNNSDCAGAGLGTPECVALDAAYRTAREEVLLVEPAARSTAQTYAINLSRYQAAARAANRLCATAVAADAARVGGAISDNILITLIQDILTQANDLITTLDPASDAAVAVAVTPPPPTEVPVTVPPPPSDNPPIPPTQPEVTVVGSTDANLTWHWEFNGVTFNGSYTGDFATSFTYTGVSVVGADVQATVQCSGRNVPVEGWDGGEARMDCTATFPANAAHGPITWVGHCAGLANYDGMLLKGGGTGTISDANGSQEKGIGACFMRPGLVPL